MDQKNNKWIRKTMNGSEKTMNGSEKQRMDQKNNE
jgi:hypothetical protein